MYMRLYNDAPTLNIMVKNKDRPKKTMVYVFKCGAIRDRNVKINIPTFIFFRFFSYRN